MDDKPERPDRASGDQTEAVVPDEVSHYLDDGTPVRRDPTSSTDPEGEVDRGSAPRRSTRTVVVLLAALVVVGLLLAFTEVPALTVIGAVILFFVIFRIGWFFLQQFATPPPPPPDPGTLRKVKLTYRCSVCGAEVRMTSAATQDPEPPRHCMEEMELVTAQE